VINLVLAMSSSVFCSQGPSPPQWPA
jgi:hypothetical protein